MPQSRSRVRGRSMTVDAELDPLLTIEEVSEYLDVTVGTLANWRYRHQGPPFIRSGRVVRYRRKDVRSWLKDNEQPAR